jgi:hypothetical protein
MMNKGNNKITELRTILVPYNLFNMTASFHHDWSLGPYNLFKMTAAFHHDGSLEPYNLFNMTASSIMMK